jgi:hypothetical protein
MDLGSISERRTGEDSGNESAGRSDGGKAAKNGTLVCDLCGAVMFERHCRILCPACGYQRDCSDP